MTSYLENMFSLKGKNILFTGAAGGIGSELAKGLAGAGAHMILTDISQPGLDKLKTEIESAGGLAHTYIHDVSSLENGRDVLKKAITEAGKIDVLVNCAGINKREGFLDVEEATYDRLMNINLKGLYFLSQDTAKHMRENHIKNPNNKSSIINIASHTSTGSLGGVSVYGATKSAVWGLTRSMAIEWAQYGIRANAIAPGHILTALTTVTWEHPERSAYLRERIALRRPGNPEEIIGAAIYLASEASSYTTGTMIDIDGGCLAGGSPWPYDTKY